MKAQIWNSGFWIEETNPKTLRELFEKLLIQAKFTLMKRSEVKFKPFGYSAAWIIAESHFCLHTFPEENKTYCELSSCNEKKQKKFMQLIKNKIIS